MSYPVESERGITFAMQWSLLNIGAALGGLITLVQTLQNGNQQAVGTGTYVAFVVIVLVSLTKSHSLAWGHELTLIFCRSVSQLVPSSSVHGTCTAKMVHRS